MRRIILSPHLDDAVLSLGGLLAHNPEQTTVITFFAGKPTSKQRTSWDARCGFEDSDIALETRIEENRKSLELLGVTDSINLEYLDGQYRSSNPAVEDLTKSSLSIFDYYLKDQSEEVRVYGPGLEVHADHALIKKVLIACASPKKEGFRYFHYQDMPYAIKIAGADGAQISNLTQKIIGNKKLINLNEKDMERKCAAIVEYSSQLEPLGGAAELLTNIKTFAKSQAVLEHSTSSYVEVVYEI